MGALKAFLRWFVLGATLFFLAQALKDHWQEVAAIRIDAVSSAQLAIALGVTLFAHIWSGWIWGWILSDLGHPISRIWTAQIYLKTNIAKYLPGNVWHFYGRVQAAIADSQISLAGAILSVVLEPLLMAAAALLIAIGGSQMTSWAWQAVSLALVLLSIHPHVLNPVLRRLGQVKARVTGLKSARGPLSLQLKRYPLRPLLGELGFLGLRGMGFLLTIQALQPVSFEQIPLLLSVFSFAWLLGLIVPGAPGGVGVFEATAIALLEDTIAPGILLGALACYRLISVLAEAAGAGLAWLDEQLDCRFDSFI